MNGDTSPDRGFTMSAPLSAEDRAFIRAILNNPAELTGWLAYADWLDEHDDLRAEYIRLEIRRLDPNISQTERFGVVAQLEDVRAMLDPGWVAMFDRPRIENCDALFAFKCPKQWETLKGTDDPYVRDCETCRKQVHYCRSIREAYDHAQQGECVAIAPDVPRSPGDLNPRAVEVQIPTSSQMVVTMGIIAYPDPAPEPPPRRKPWWKFW